MKLTIEKRHVEKAIACNKNGDITQQCPVFQACHEADLSFSKVGYDYVQKDDKWWNLDEVAKKITNLQREEWPSIQTPIEIELTEA